MFIIIVVVVIVIIFIIIVIIHVFIIVVIMGELWLFKGIIRPHLPRGTLTRRSALTRPQIVRADAEATAGFCRMSWSHHGPGEPHGGKECDVSPVL